MDNFLFVCAPCRPRGEQQGSTRRGTHTPRLCTPGRPSRPPCPGPLKVASGRPPLARAPAVPGRDPLRLCQGSGWQCRRVSIPRAPDSGRPQIHSPPGKCCPRAFPPAGPRGSALPDSSPSPRATGTTTSPNQLVKKWLLRGRLRGERVWPAAVLGPTCKCVSSPPFFEGRGYERIEPAEALA